MFEIKVVYFKLNLNEFGINRNLLMISKCVTKQTAINLTY